MSGLFYTFNIAKRGMAAQQTSLHVTSHNVANVNTYGFSKQRAVHKTTNPFPMPALNNPVGAGQLGTGVEVAEISRARDEFIDISIRRETSNLVTYSARLQFLDSIEAIMNEPGDTGLSKMISKFWNQWEGVSQNPENASSLGTLVSDSNALADSFKQTYTQLEELEKDLSNLQRNQIYEVNSLLKQIANVNEQIKLVTINKQTPNDLMDRRDVLLDKLSENINFKIEQGDFNSIRIITTSSSGDDRYLLTDSRVINGIASVDDVKFTVGKDDDKRNIDKSDFPVNIKEGDLPVNVTLKVYIDGDVNRPVDVIKEITKDNIKDYFNVSYNDGKIQIDAIKNSSLMYTKGTKDDALAVQNYGEPFDFRSGAIKGLDKQKEEISNYKNQINNVVRSLVISINTIHSNNRRGEFDPTDPDKNNYINFFEFIDENNNVIDYDKCDHPAKSFKVNEVIEKNNRKINLGSVITDGDKKPLPGDNDRAKRIAELRNIRLDLANIKKPEDFIKQAYGKDIDGKFGQKDGEDLSTQKLQQSNTGDTLGTYYQGMVGQLGISAQEAGRVVENQEEVLLQLSLRRQEVSGVSIDDEMIDMMQFQRAYQANSKMINVIDELLDLVVNRLVR